MPYSPTRGVACLEVRPFAPPVCLSFGQLMAGHTGQLSFKLLNNEDRPSNFVIETSGGNKVCLRVCPCAGCIPPNGDAEVTVTWKPSAVGNMRTSLHLRITTDGDELCEVRSTRYSLRVALVGSCIMPGENTIQEDISASVKNKEAKMRGKIFAGTADGASKRREERYVDAKREIMQNGRGAEQVRRQLNENASVEEDVYRRFLNYILMSDMFVEDCPPAEGEIPHVNLRHILSSEHSPTLSKPGKEKMTLRQYTTQRKMNELRHDAHQLFCSLKQMVYRVFQLVEDRKIVIRPEMDIHVDQGLRQLTLNILLSITPLWLRLGLETVFCEVIPLTSCNDVKGIAHFILTRLLNDPVLLKRYSIAHVRNAFKNGYKEAISKFFLQKLFALLIFLDHAKSKRIVKSDPCLFYRRCEHKSVREVLILFNKELLNADGNILKVLASVGYHPTYEQTWYDEKPRLITNLATDLRDGALLARLAGILSGNANLYSDLRGPPISRLQKVHNVEVAMKELASIGIPLNGCDANSIVAGHRERTLGLLWQIICFKLGFPKDPLQSPVFFEVMRLRRLLSRLQDKSEVVSRLLAIPLTSDMSPSDVFAKWIAAVSSLFDVEVDNLNLSLFDGRALCCLVSYYLPFMLPRDRIEFETTMCNRGEEFVPYDKLKSNDLKNRSIFLKAVEEMGDVPWLISFDELVRFDGRGVKNEKVLLLCLNSLASSLFALGHQHRAASVIQQAWRRRHINCIKEKAAITIQRYWRHHGRHVVLVKQILALGRLSLAARKIQKAWRSYKERKCRLHSIVTAEAEAAFHLTRRIDAQSCAHTVGLKLCSAARLDVEAPPPSDSTTLDMDVVSEIKGTHGPNYRHLSANGLTLGQNELVLLMQSYGRRTLALERYMKELLAACVIQRAWRSYLSRRHSRVAVTDGPYPRRAVESPVESLQAGSYDDMLEQEGKMERMSAQPTDIHENGMSGEFEDRGLLACFQGNGSATIETYNLASNDIRNEIESAPSPRKSSTPSSASKSRKSRSAADSDSCKSSAKEEKGDILVIGELDPLPASPSELCPSPKTVDELFGLFSPAKKFKLAMNDSNVDYHVAEDAAACNGADSILKPRSPSIEEAKQNKRVISGEAKEDSEAHERKVATDTFGIQVRLSLSKMRTDPENVLGQFACLITESKNVEESMHSDGTNISDISFRFDELPSMSCETGNFPPADAQSPQDTSGEHGKSCTARTPSCTSDETETSVDDESETTAKHSGTDSGTQGDTDSSSSTSSRSTDKSPLSSVEVQSAPTIINAGNEPSGLFHLSKSETLPPEPIPAGVIQNETLPRGKSLSISTPNYSCSLSTSGNYGNRSSELSLGSLNKCDNLFEEIMKAETGVRPDPYELTCPLSGMVPGILPLQTVAYNEQEKEDEVIADIKDHGSPLPETPQEKMVTPETTFNSQRPSDSPTGPPPCVPIATPQRAEAAVCKLLSCDRLATVRNGLLELYAMSTVSETKCGCLVEQKVPKVLYGVIKRLNRGYACMESKTIAVKCLDEISVYHRLRPSVVAPPEWLTCLSDLLLSAKNGYEELFFTVISVLCRLSNLDKAKAQIRLSKDVAKRWRNLKNFFASRAASFEKMNGMDNLDGSLPDGSLAKRNGCRLNAMCRLLDCYGL